MGRTFLEAVAKRRSYYKLGESVTIDDNSVVELVDSMLATLPSPFNVQSARIVILFGEEHRALWDIVIEELRDIVSADKFEATHRRINEAFRSGRGTLLFYEDTSTLETLKRNYPLYADKVDAWSEQCSGMHQFAIWTALEDMGYGASLQHYNPLIDESVAKRWSINDKWQLIAEMPFGEAKDVPSSRSQTSPPRDRMRVYGLYNK